MYFLELILCILLVVLYQLLSFPKAPCKHFVEPASYFTNSGIFSLDVLGSTVLFEDREILLHDLAVEIKLAQKLSDWFLIPISLAIGVAILGILSKIKTQHQDQEHFTDVNTTNDNKRQIADDEIIPQKKGTGKYLNDVGV